MELDRLVKFYVRAFFEEGGGAWHRALHLTWQVYMLRSRVRFRIARPRFLIAIHVVYSYSFAARSCGLFVLSVPGRRARVNSRNWAFFPSVGESASVRVARAT